MNWTDEQKQIFNLEEKKNGKFVVKACPGSGKTSSIAYRLFNLIKDYDDNLSGIATLSFTNVATEEIKDKYANFSGGKNILFPHYVGTIDSFINNYIFLPFGHLVMKCKKRPILVGEPYSFWNGNTYYESFFDKLTISKDTDEVIVIKNNKSISSDELDDIKPFKRKLNRKGFANQSDANYYAMKILEKYPKISKSLSIRFPYMIVDEAQDTSDTQMRILELLMENGLENLVLVGDPNQSIFEWNEANPKLLLEKFNDWKKDSIQLSLNFRSSQIICNFISKLSNEKFSSELKNKSINKGNDFIISHHENYGEIIQKFLKTCANNGIEINNNNVAVLFRSKSEMKKIFSNSKQFDLQNIWKSYSGKNKLKKKERKRRISFSKNIIEGKYLWDNQNYEEGFKLIEKSLIKIQTNKTDINNTDIVQIIHEKGFYNHRKEVLEFINLLPLTSSNLKINDWMNEVNFILEKYYNQKLYELKLTDYGNPFKNNVTFTMLFSNPKDFLKVPYCLSTVHGVKGKSFDAVLLFLKKRGARESYYSTLLKDRIKLEDSEELRIVYVALTRAKSFLKMAVPEDDYFDWNNFFYSIPTTLEQYS